MFRIRPVLRYASRKVSEPRVKNVHCPPESECAKPDRIPPKTFFAHSRASNLAPKPDDEHGVPQALIQTHLSSKTSCTIHQMTLHKLLSGSPARAPEVS